MAVRLVKAHQPGPLSGVGHRIGLQAWWCGSHLRLQEPITTGHIALQEHTHLLGKAGPAGATATCRCNDNICCWYDMLCGLHRSHVVGLETRNCCVLSSVLWQTHHTVVALLVGGGVSKAASQMQQVAVSTIDWALQHKASRKRSLPACLARATILPSRGCHEQI